MITLHKATYRFTTILIQMSMKIFTNMEQRILKFVWNHKKKVKSQRNLETEWQKGRASWFQTILQRCINQTVWYCYKKWTQKSLEENRDPRNKSKYMWSINLWQKSRDYSIGKGLSLQKWCCESWTVTCKRMKLKNSYTIPKINSKWIKDFDHKSWSHKNPRRGTSLVAVVKNPPTNAGDSSVILDPGRSQMPRSNSAHSPELLSLCFRAREQQLSSPRATTTKARCPPACSPQQNKPLQ